MADNKPSAAKTNALGELYVDFGARGLDTLVKGLNGISAQFLLTKNAAQQAIKPLVSMSKTAANNITSLDKLNSVTGISIRQLQSLQQWSKLNNISFDEMAGQIQGLQQNLLDIKMGTGNVKGLALLGIDPRSLDYTRPIEALDLIRTKVQQVDEATGAMALRELGLSQDLLYAFKQQNNAIDARLLLTDKEQQQLKNQQSAWNELSATWESAQQKFISNQTWINSLLKNTTRFLNAMPKDVMVWELPKAIGETIGGKLGREFKKHYLKGAMDDTLPWYLKNPVVEVNPVFKAGSQAIARNLYNNSPDVHKTPIKHIQNPFGLETIHDMPNDNNFEYLDLPPVPQNLDNSTHSNSKNVTVNVTQNITGNNAEEIGLNSADNIKRYFTVLEQGNLSGL